MLLRGRDGHMNVMQRIRAACPHLEIDSIDLGMSGRFNDVVIVNNAIVFRFPRYRWVAENLRNEIAILRKLNSLVSISIPKPANDISETQALDDNFLSYPMILGVPL